MVRPVYSMKRLAFLVILPLVLLGCTGGKTTPTPSPQPNLRPSPAATNALPASPVASPTPSPTEEAVIPTSTYTPAQPPAMITLSPSAGITLTPTYRPTRTYVSSRMPSPKPSPTPTILFSENLKAPGWIAVSSLGNDGHGIDILRANGSDHRRLTGEKVYDYFFEQPAWSPDGLWIAFMREGQDGIYQLYIIKTDGTQLKQLTFDPGNKSRPSWSPDGQRIVYNASVNGQSDIFVINWDGSGKKALANSPLREHSPAWSPDGQKIAYLYQQEKVGGLLDAYPQDIYIMNPNGTDKRVVTRSASWGSSPAWSPDSNQLVFQSFKDCSLYVVNTDGSGLRRLTNAPLSAANPTWSPDGRYIAFDASDQNCEYGGMVVITDVCVDVIDMDSGQIMQIPTNQIISIMEPAWAPVPHLQLGGTYTLTTAGADLHLREAPSLDAKIIQKLKTGDTVTILEGPVEADYYYWWRMRTADSVVGWAVDVLGWYAIVP